MEYSYLWEKRKKKSKKALKKAREFALSDGNDKQDKNGPDLTVNDGNSKGVDGSKDRCDPSALAHYVRSATGDYRRKQLEDDVRLMLGLLREAEMADDEHKSKTPKTTPCYYCKTPCKAKKPDHACNSCGRPHPDICGNDSAGKGPQVPQAK